MYVVTRTVKKKPVLKTLKVIVLYNSLRDGGMNDKVMIHLPILQRCVLLVKISL